MGYVNVSKPIPLALGVTMTIQNQAVPIWCKYDI